MKQPISAPDNLLAILVLGLGMQRFGLPRAGAWIVATTLAGALVFGLANHFLIAGTDHVSHVSGPWARLFATTAAFLVVTELSGVMAALWCALGTPRRVAAQGMR